MKNNKLDKLLKQAQEIGEISYQEAMNRAIEYVKEDFERQEKFFEGATGIVVDFRLRLLNHNGEIHRIHPRHYKEYGVWRLAVFTRDNFTCQQCGSNKNIQAHHIEQYALKADKRLDLDNGITLCKTCHNKIPRKRLPKDE